MPTNISPKFFAFAITAAIVFSSTLHAENWGSWRGPRGDGSVRDAAPVHWNGEDGTNIKWKSEIPGSGHSSPIVWNDRVFVTACLPDIEERVLICINRDSGAIRWRQSVMTTRLESKHALNSFASSTPATDGKMIYVAFMEADDQQIVAPNVGNERLIYPGSMVVAAYDFDGNQKWITKPGPFISAHGFCSNPILYQDLVILNGDHDGDSYLIALHRDTGEIVWKQPRRHRTRSYCTPLIRTINGDDQLVLSGSLCLASFEPGSGTPIWNIEGPTEQFVASLVHDGLDFYAVGGYPTHHVISVRPTGNGDVSQTHVQWHETNVRCYVPSPVLVKNFLVVADDRGTVNCFDTKTGSRYWQNRMGRHYSASLLATDQIAYLCDDDGVTKLLKAGPEAEIIAENPLGEKVYASPAVSNGQLFIRGNQHLYCIQE